MMVSEGGMRITRMTAQWFCRKFTKKKAPQAKETAFNSALNRGLCINKLFRTIFNPYLISINKHFIAFCRINQLFATDDQFFLCACFF